MTAPRTFDRAPTPDRDPASPRRARPRASVLGQVATLTLVALSWAAVDQAAGSPDLRRFAVGGWLALVAGTAIGTLTPASRPFRRVSTFAAAIAVAATTAYLLASSGAVDASTWFALWLLVAGILGLDLCWVARLRVWVFLSGIFVIPALVVPGRGQVLWAAAWLAGAFATLWVLSADVHRSLARPATDTPVRRVRPAPFDLGRILLTGVTLGIALGLLANSPGYSYQPLERLVRYLPFRPDLDLALDLDLDVRDYEVDTNGNEVRYRLTPEGQRFVLDPRTNEPFAVIERDGVDVFVAYDGTEVATVSEGASVLEVPSADDSASTTFQRDDEGWYLRVDGTNYRAELQDGTAVLTAPSGAERPATDGAVDVTSDPAFAALAAAGTTTVQLPRAAVLEGTVGEGTRVWSYGDTIEVAGWRQGRRTYDIDEPGLEVEVRRRGDDMEYTWTADRSKLTVYVPDLNQAGSLRMDRSGNAFDYLETLLAEQQADADRDVMWATWGARARRVAVAIAGLAAVAGAVLLVLRRRRGPVPDRTWAEATLVRLERVGDARTDPRRPAESVVAYLGRLATEVDGDDDRLHDVAEVLDGALYGADPLASTDRARVDEIVADLEAVAPPDDPDRGDGGDGGDGGPPAPDVDLTDPDAPDRRSALTPT